MKRHVCSSWPIQCFIGRENTDTMQKILNSNLIALISGPFILTKHVDQNWSLSVLFCHTFSLQYSVFQSNWMKESIARAVSPTPGASPDDSSSSPPSSPKRTASPSSTSPPLKRSRLHGPDRYNDVVEALENEDSDEN